MSANFHFNATVMVGVDLHKAMLPAPADYIPHLVIDLFFLVSNDKRTPTVTTMTLQMIQGGHSLQPVPHIPLVPAVYNPLGLACLAINILASSSKAQLSVNSVHGQGSPMATAIYAWFGLNVNCNSPVSMPTGMTISPTTVQTSPTLGDYLTALLAYVIDAAISYFIGKWVKGLTKGITDKLLNQYVSTLVKMVIKQLQTVTGLKPGDIVRKWLQGHF
jgi:hypothetical protein